MRSYERLLVPDPLEHYARAPNGATLPGFAHVHVDVPGADVGDHLYYDLRWATEPRERKLFAEWCRRRFGKRHSIHFGE